MPHIRVRGAEKEKVRDFTAGLADELVIIAECPADWFTFEYVETTFFFDGKEDDGLVFIEVLWFDRDSEARDKIAALFTERWKKITDKIVTIVFNPLIENMYYEDGVHF